MSVLIGLVIGLVLGLTGAGGSIFAVPLLMLLLGLPINDAIGIALGAVAVSALIGTLSNWRAQYILWVPAISLGLGGALIAPIGKQLGSQLPPMVLLAGFCALAFIIAGIMWRQTVTTPEQANIVRSGHSIDNNLIRPICRFSPEDQFDTSYKCIGALIGCGLVVGLLSGLFGVGGGFLIVPALLSISQVSMQSPMKNSPLAGEEILFELVQSPETVINVYEVVAEASTAYGRTSLITSSTSEYWVDSIKPIEKVLGLSKYLLPSLRPNPNTVI